MSNIARAAALAVLIVGIVCWRVLSRPATMTEISRG